MIKQSTTWNMKMFLNIVKASHQLNLKLQVNWRTKATQERVLSTTAIYISDKNKWKLTIFRKFIENRVGIKLFAFVPVKAHT